MQPSRILFLILSLFLALASLVWLAGVTTPVQAGATLPPRELPTPEEDDDDDDNGPASPVGAYISLQAGAVPAGAWSVVQWQDSNGDWQMVEGWQGPAASNTRWWVAAKDFGRGPFRWAILSGPGGAVLEASSPFTLPQQPNETVFTSIAAGQ